MAVGKGKAAPAASERDSFTDGGEERNIAEAWIPEKPGEAIIGRLVRITDIKTKVSRDGETAPIAEFGPVVARDAQGGKVAYAALALMLSAALRLRIRREADIGKVFAIRYDGEEPSGKGNPMHKFTVVEHQDAQRLAHELRLAGWEGADDLPF